MLKDGYYMSPNDGVNEYEEIQCSLEKVNIKSNSEGDCAKTTNNSMYEYQQKNIIVIIRRCVSPVFFQIFIMTFFAVSIEQI